MADDLYHEFMGEILNQLYENRENHRDHKGKGISYMAYTLFEQGGHLADALREKNWKLARREVFHVAAILYELYERIEQKNEEYSAALSGSIDGDDKRENSDAVVGSVPGDGVEPGADSGACEVGEAAGEWEGAGAPDND